CGVTTSDEAPTLAADNNEFLRLLVALLARRGKQPGTFTVFEAAAGAQLPEPHHHSLWGIGTGIARREGLIVPVDAVPSLRPKTSKSLVRLWVGARFAQGGDDHE